MVEQVRYGVAMLRAGRHSDRVGSAGVGVYWAEYAEEVRVHYEEHDAVVGSLEAGFELDDGCRCGCDCAVRMRTEMVADPVAHVVGVVGVAGIAAAAESLDPQGQLDYWSRCDSGRAADGGEDREGGWSDAGLVVPVRDPSSTLMAASGLVAGDPLRRPALKC